VAIKQNIRNIDISLFVKQINTDNRSKLSEKASFYTVCVKLSCQLRMFFRTTRRSVVKMWKNFACECGMFSYEFAKLCKFPASLCSQVKRKCFDLLVILPLYHIRGCQWKHRLIIRGTTHTNPIRGCVELTVAPVQYLVAINTSPKIGRLIYCIHGGTICLKKNL